MIASRHEPIHPSASARPVAPQHGFALLYVMLMLMVVALASFALNRQGAARVDLVRGESEAQLIEFVAEAGYQHALWRARHAACSNYMGLTDEPFGTYSYSAMLTPSSGSPIDIAADAQLANGSYASVHRSSIPIQDLTAPVSFAVQPGPSQGKDTYLEGAAGHVTHNKGGANDLRTNSQSSNAYRLLLSFDLSFIPANALILSATLELNLTANTGSPQVVYAHRIVRDWTEDGATWLTHDGLSLWQTPGGDYAPEVVASFMASGTGWKSMDISSLVQSWAERSQPNYGLILRSTLQPGNHEKKYTSSDDGSASLRPKLVLSYACECGTVCEGLGNELILSTDSAATLGGLSFTQYDLVEYDLIDLIADLVLDGSSTTLTSRIDALHVLENGHFLLSTDANATLGGASFSRDDLVDYDPVADVATVVFNGSSLFFDDNENVVSVHVLDNGHLVLSTDAVATLAGLTFSAIDLVEYDPRTDTASLFFDGSTTSLDEAIDAVHVRGDGRLVLSARDSTTLGGVSFERDDLVEYDPIADSGTLIFDGSAHFGNPNEAVISAHVGPGSGSLQSYAHYRDDFNATSYSGSDGSIPWTSPWIEDDDDGGGPWGGNIRVDDNRLRIRAEKDGDRIYRQADLSSAASATLNFRVDNDLEDDDRIRVQISANGGSSWSTLKTYTSANRGFAVENFDITAWIASNTRIRFIVIEDDEEERLYVDNVQIVLD